MRHRARAEALRRWELVHGITSTCQTRKRRRVIAVGFSELHSALVECVVCERGGSLSKYVRVYALIAVHWSSARRDIGSHARGHCDHVIERLLSDNALQIIE